MSGHFRPLGTGAGAEALTPVLLLELVLVALARPRLGAEAALEAAGAHARRRAAGLRVAGAPALRGAVAVAAGLHALGLAFLLGEVRRPRRVAEALLLVTAGQGEEGVERAGGVVGFAGRGAALRGAGADPVRGGSLGLGGRGPLPNQQGRHPRV